MARILVTGSSDGLGRAASRTLVRRGHEVYLHARNAQRAEDAKKAVPGAKSVLIADLSKLEEQLKMAAEANNIGTFEAVIHNAGLYHGGFRKTDLGLPSLTMVNSVAPYVLTCLMNKPKRLLFVSSGMHSGGDATLKDWAWQQRGERGWQETQAYSDSKFHNVLLAFAFARRWKDVEVNSMDPRWIATKMGGKSAPHDINDAIGTYVMAAEGCGKTGKFLQSSRVHRYNRAADDVKLQDKLLQELEKLTGVEPPTTQSELKTVSLAARIEQSGHSPSDSPSS